MTTAAPIFWLVVGGSGGPGRRHLDPLYLKHGAAELDRQLRFGYDAGYRRIVIDSYFGFEDGKHKPITARRELMRENTDGRYDAVADVGALGRVLRYWGSVRGCELIWYPGRPMGDASLDRLQRPMFYDNWLAELRYNLYPALNNGCSVALDAVYGNGPGDPATHIAGLLRSLGIKTYLEPWPSPATPPPPGGDFPSIIMYELWAGLNHHSPPYCRLLKDAEGIVITKTRNSDFAATKKQIAQIMAGGYTPAVDTWRVKVSDFMEAE